MSATLTLPDAAATDAFGGALAAALPADTAGWTLLLQGELGAGKSTLARAMLRGFGHAGPVPSPTYTLVEPYELPGRLVYHVDLYRISDESELPFLGWSDLRDGLMLVEWPERVPRLLEEADLKVELGFAGAGRDAVVTAHHERAAGVLDRLDRSAGGGMG